MDVGANDASVCAVVETRHDGTAGVPAHVVEQWLGRAYAVDVTPAHICADLVPRGGDEPAEQALAVLQPQVAGELDVRQGRVCVEDRVSLVDAQAVAGAGLGDAGLADAAASFDFFSSVPLSPLSLRREPS